MRLLSATLLLLLAAPLAGQSPTDRSTLAAWQDTLDLAATPARLGALEPFAARSVGEVGSLRLSLFRLQSAIVARDRNGIRTAVSGALSDASRHPDWAWPRFVLARAFFAADSLGFPPQQGNGLLMGEDYVEGGWRTVREALTLDPSFRAARRLALEVALPMGDREQFGAALATIALLAKAPSPDPDALLAWARVLRKQQRYDSSLVLLNRAATLGGDPSRLALERAWTLFALHDSTSATRAYWEGVDRLTPAGRQMYRTDLAWIVSEDSVAAFDALPNAEVALWLRRFWTERDAGAVKPHGDRLLEQMRRRVYALEFYRISKPWRRTMYARVEVGTFDIGRPCIGSGPAELYERLGTQPALAGDLRRNELLFDHRGALYLRHGEPMVRVGSVLMRLTQEELDADPDATDADYRAAESDDRKVRANESWVYFMDGDWRMLNFQGSDALGTYAPTTLRSYLPLIYNAYWDRGGVMTSYARVAAEIRRHQQSLRNLPPGGSRKLVEPLECNQTVLQTLRQSRKDAELATTTDSDTPPLVTPWTSVVRTYALGDAVEGNGRALITFAVAAKNLATVPAGDGRTEYPVNFRVVAYEAARDQWIQIDSLRRLYASRTLSDKSWVTGAIEVPLPGGKWQVSVLANQDDPGGGTYAMRRGLAVDSGSVLSLSDLVAGRKEGVPWTAPDGREFPLNPTMAWPLKSELELYYEVRGLGQGTSYRATVQIRDPQNQRVLLNVASDDRAVARFTPVRRTVNLDRLKQGTYQLLVRIAHGDNVVERTTLLTVSR